MDMHVKRRGETYRIDETSSIRRERASDRVMNANLSKRRHHEIQGKRDDEKCNDDGGRASSLQSSSGSDEQTSADVGANGYHLYE